MATNPDDYALVIGINEYPDYLGGRRNLQGAINDAESFAAWLRDMDAGGGLPHDNVTLLTGPELDRGDVDRALRSIINRTRDGGRRLYFFVAAHGQARRIDDVAVLLPHWSMVMRQAALDATRYRAVMRECLPFDEVVAFFDCCRAGTADVTGYGSEVSCATARAGAGAGRYFTAFAAEYQRQSYEDAARGPTVPAPQGAPVDPDVAEEGAIVQGYFTKALIEALRGGAARPEGGVTSPALKGFLERHVGRLARKDGYAQQPEIAQNVPEDRPLVFGSAPPRPPFGATDGLGGGVSVGGSVGALPSDDADVADGPRHQVRLVGIADPLTRIVVHDGHDVAVYDSREHNSAVEDAWAVTNSRGRDVESTVELSLPAGLYRITAMRLAQSSEQLVRITGDVQIGVDLPVRRSPMPVFDADTTHEYYVGPVSRHVTEWTGPPIGDGVHTGSLFVMIRGRHAGEHDGRHLGRDFAVLTPDGDLVTTFLEAGAADGHDGWAILSVEAVAGPYVLSYRGADWSREAALWVAPGRQTRVFLHNGRDPVFPTAVLQMPDHRSEFDPTNVGAMLVDGALAGLQSGLAVLPDDVLHELLWAKFTDPLLGLIGAHHFLRKSDPDPSFIDTVYGNLSDLLGPETPDVQGIAARAALSGFPITPEGTLADVPMLRASADALYHWAAVEGRDIAPGSPLDRVATERIADSPWSTWTPPERVLGIAPVDSAIPDWLVYSILEETRGQIRRTGLPVQIDVGAVAARHTLPRPLAASAVAIAEQVLDPVTVNRLALQGIAQRAAVFGPPEDLTPSAARQRFEAGDAEQRVEVLGWMTATPSLADHAVLATAAADPDLRLVARSLSMPIDENTA